MSPHARPPDKQGDDGGSPGSPGLPQASPQGQGGDETRQQDGAGMNISWNFHGGLGNWADQEPHGEGRDEEGFSLVSRRRQRVGKIQEQSNESIGADGQTSRTSGGGRQSREIEMREGDWRCLVQECRGEINFKRRKECWKCGSDKKGNCKVPESPRISGDQRRPVFPPRMLGGEVGGERRSRGQGDLGLSPTERIRRIEQQQGPIRRAPKMVIVTINVAIDNKTRIRPEAMEHYNIIRQAGLDKDEVKGVLAKPGYLEVAMVPGAVSVAGALRESTKQVNNKIMITNVRERGSNRVIVLKWQEVPFEVKDETLIQYTDLFAVPERAGMRLWWETVKEENDHEGKIVGTWTGERSLAVRLKPDIGHIPTWHYVGGARLKLYVPGRRNCARCLKSAGECKGGGDWKRCEASGVPRGDWKVEQEHFLESVGWGEKKQKIMEGLEDHLPALLGEEEEVEARAMEEQAEREAETREGLVQQLEAGKKCGGVILRNFPEMVEGQVTEKKALLMMVIVMSNLGEEEEEARLWEAQVDVSRMERRGQKVLDLRLALEDSDVLLRKVWNRLEKVCKQEGIKRYQIEARTSVTPAKTRPPTELEKARERVKELLDMEKESRRKKIRKEEEEIQERAQLQKKSERLSRLLLSWQRHLLNSIGEQEKSYPLALTYLEEGESREQVDQDLTDRKVVQGQQTGHDMSEDDDAEAEESVSRIKKAKWIPPEGWRRCGHGCEGCASKCAEQGLEDCQGCYLNKANGGSSNSCHNRGECKNLKEQKPPEERRARTKSKIAGRRETASLSITRNCSASRSPATMTKVGSQLVVSKPELVKEVVGALEERGGKTKSLEIAKAAGKREREKSGFTPENEKKASKIALPGWKGGAGAGGRVPPAARL